MNQVGFDSEKYIRLQSEHIRERINQFGGKLYLEFGGKLFDDYHASRVLPGFEPDNKIKMLLALKDQAEIVIAINADDIEKNKRRGDLGITYDTDVARLIDVFRGFGLYVGSIAVTQYAGQPAADVFEKRMHALGLKVYRQYRIPNYPSDVRLIVSDEGYGRNDYIETTRSLVVVTAPGPGSGKMATCLSQLYHEHKRGVKAGYAKFETFPIWNLPLKHPVNIAYEAATADLNDVKETLQRQIDCNTAIAKQGLEGHWGAEIGRILLRSYGDSVHNRAKAWAAAGSDAGMNGCEQPVVINSGSGNQGLTASLPVIIYARDMGASRELLYRALLVSNLVTIHLKTGIGPLSAYCGATSAGCGAGAGITYLHGGRYNEIAHTVVNALAINSGMVCDGAKASCAAKIASAVEAGLLGMQMQMHDSEFVGGDGIVLKGVENTIRNVSKMAHDGMAETDREIIRLMIAPQEGAASC